MMSSDLNLYPRKGVYTTPVRVLCSSLKFQLVYLAPSIVYKKGDSALGTQIADS